MHQEVKIVRGENTLECILSCEIDHHHAKTLRERVDHALFADKPRVLILDFSAVPFMDSSGIAFVLGRASSARTLGAELHLRGLGRENRRLLALSEIEKQPNITIE
ncbi:MAG: STAS domain-containing protein [Clostridia bacterium]|nr:STAS domain-containing protein [Clostridia bacterium]